VTKKLSRPSGDPAPTTAELADGTVAELRALAAETTERYAQAFPDEDDRYSPEWRAWATHDNQHVLWWALNAGDGVDFWAEVSWLARILESRGFPLDRLAASLNLAAEVLIEHFGDIARAPVRELRHAAAEVISTKSFLTGAP
jgi:hypothetical protein